MFDIRPVDETGDLDWKKIKKIKKRVELKEKGGQWEIEIKNKKEEPFQSFEKIPFKDYWKKFPKKPEVYKWGKKIKSDDLPVLNKSSYQPKKQEELVYFKKIYETPQKEDLKKNQLESREINEIASQNNSERKVEAENQMEHTYEDVKRAFHDFEYAGEEFTRKKIDFNFRDIFVPAKFAFSLNPKKTAFAFGIISFLIAFLVGGVSFGFKGIKIKGEVLGVSQEGYSELNLAIENIKSQNFESSNLAFENSYKKFSIASENLDEIGRSFIEISRFLPFSSKLSSGKNLVEAGKHISTAGKSLSKIAKTIKSIENPFGEKDKNISLLEIFKTTEKDIRIVNDELKEVEKNIKKVNIADLPEDKQKQFISLGEKLPDINQTVSDFLVNSEVFVDLLGGNGPRKYLFLFQNNHEMRATGGFIGSYGLLDISDGRVRNFFIDGIFNPDGQLQEKIVPPKPIQKISAAWSLHDSNWFPNFPTSAKEAIVFYEKTGGPTVDGVITLTPTMIQKLLEITGPIEMKEYDVTIDSKNFIEKTQYKVEIDYDKEENKPKKILSDLAPIILDKIFNTSNSENIAKTIGAISSGLSEKHILLYFENQKLQEIISKKNWTGEILDAQKDYLSVINSNINGYKTDGVIDETITHSTEIQNNGEIINTVQISRYHKGGNFDYEWWNKVNANYMRVYVPLGSKLLEVQGQTRETVKEPLDYLALGFRRNSLIEKEENSMITDEKSGTKIYEENGKTVFANWTYVSPKETMEIKYKYLLPFKINNFSQNKPADSYSLLVQKQSGSIGSKLFSNISFPKNFNVIWNYPEYLTKENSNLEIETDLKTDKFFGLVFTKEGIIND